MPDDPRGTNVHNGRPPGAAPSALNGPGRAQSAAARGWGDPARRELSRSLHRRGAGQPDRRRGSGNGARPVTTVAGSPDWSDSVTHCARYLRDGVPRARRETSGTADALTQTFGHEWLYRLSDSPYFLRYQW